jgi:hypothetical protein
VEIMTGLCQGCRRIRALSHTDEADRSYCADCADLLPVAQSAVLVAFLANTVPYREGDIVSCKTGAQVYDGIGHVVQVSFSPEDLASPVVPMFRVAIDEPAYPEVPNEVWYSEICMSRVTDKEASGAR